MRSGRIAAIVIASCLGCVSVPPAAREQLLRVMSYNIQYGSEGLDSVIAVINAERPDVVGLQEVDVHWSARSGFANQAELLAKGTGMEYRFARIYSLPASDSSKPPREFGVAVLSRYPVVSWMNHEITRHSTQEANAAPSPMPGFLEAVIDVRGRRVRVFVTHLDYRRDPAVRSRQVAGMLAVMGDVREPTLLIGDMNAPPDAREIAPLMGPLRDTWQYSIGPGLTSPAKNPAVKIDYVFASRGFRVRRTWIPKVAASDHLPVMADLTMEAGS